MGKINYEMRKNIEYLINRGFNETQIAKEVGVNQSSISRELKRSNPYTAKDAQDHATNKRYKKKNDVELVTTIKTLLSVGKSKAYISRYCKCSKQFVTEIKEMVK